MSKPTTDERLQAIHTDALAQFDDIQDALREERLACLNDRRFYSIAGAQWEDKLGEQFKNKPKIEVNKIHLSILRIINEYRNNRITVSFGSKDGAKDIGLADSCAGLFRADEHDSTALEAYDNAFEEAVGGGFGAWRLRAEYEDEDDPDNEQQRIRIEPIYDADSSVFFDLDAKRQDKSDARYCFVVKSITRERYKADWDDDVSTWDKSISSSAFDWAPPDLVYIAEYYLVEERNDTRITYKGLGGDEQVLMASVLKADPTKAEELTATGYQVVKSRRFKSRKIHKYILSGAAVLSDEGYIAGKCIPIVPTYGKRWFVDGVERCMGHVRLAKDAQRLKNMQLSKLAELSAQSSVEKPIFLAEQITGHEDLWSNDNIDNYPYLVIEPITDKDGNIMPAAPVAYTHAPAVPQALAALLTLTDIDIKELLGTPQEDKMLSNIAEKTFLSMKAAMDMQTYIYMSNFAKAVLRGGEIWLSMASELYVEDGRQMKTIDATDTIKSVTLMEPSLDPETGGLTNSVNLSRAKLDVAVDVGPSSASRREATVKTLTGMLQATQATQDPETAQVLMSMAIMNMEGEGIGDVRNFFRAKLVRMGVIKPTDEEAQTMAAQAAQEGPSAQDKALIGMADESEAKATKARVDSLKGMAEVEKLHAETMAILADTDMSTAEKAVLLMEKYGSGGIQMPGDVADDTHHPALVGDKEAVLSARAAEAQPGVAKAVDQANLNAMPSFEDGKSANAAVEAAQEYYRELRRQRGPVPRIAGGEYSDAPPHRAAFFPKFLLTDSVPQPDEKK